MLPPKNFHSVIKNQKRLCAEQTKTTGTLNKKKTNKQSSTVLNLSSDISVQNNLRATEKKEGRSSSACGNLAVATDVGEKKHQQQ